MKILARNGDMNEQVRHKLLPSEPEPEMIKAASQILFSDADAIETMYVRDSLIAAWKAAPAVDQEPVGYWNGKETVFFSHELAGYKQPSDCFIPLYTNTQPNQSEQSLDMVKREPLSDAEAYRLMVKGCSLGDTIDLMAFIRLVEQAHGIGVE
jgi:hypothetical protein